MLKRAVITIRQGSDEIDQKSALLHECAHWLVGTKQGHSRQFYAEVLKLYDSFGDLRIGARCETQYRMMEAADGIRHAGSEPSLVTELLNAGGLHQTPNYGRVHMLAGSDGKTMVEIMTPGVPPEDERAAIEADVRANQPVGDGPLTFAVGRFRYKRSR